MTTTEAEAGLPAGIGGGIIADHPEWAHLAEPWSDAGLVIITREMAGAFSAPGPALMTERECDDLVDEWCAGVVTCNAATRFQWAASREAPARTTGPMSGPVPDDDAQRASAEQLRRWGASPEDTSALTRQFGAEEDS